MLKLSACFLFSLILSQHLAAQNYYYIRDCSSPQEKNNLLEQMKYVSGQFDMENVTFAIIISKLPKKVEATTTYSFNKVVDRSMVLFRVNKNLAQRLTFRVLAHEMAHAYQYYSRQLIRHNRDCFSYKGVRYQNAEDIPHSKRPWEIEAIRYAQQIVGEAGFTYSQKKQASSSTLSQLK